MPTPVAWLEALGRRHCPDRMSALNIKTSLRKSDSLERVFMFEQRMCELKVDLQVLITYSSFMWVSNVPLVHLYLYFFEFIKNAIHACINFCIKFFLFFVIYIYIIFIYFLSILILVKVFVISLCVKKQFMF